jgi:hypothetical protein
MNVAGRCGIINELALHGCAVKVKGTDVDELMLTEQLPFNYVSDLLVE